MKALIDKASGMVVGVAPQITIVDNLWFDGTSAYANPTIEGGSVIDCDDSVTVGLFHTLNTTPPFSPPPPPPAPTQADYEKALNALYDSQAQTHRYDNRVLAALRAGYEGPFKAEGVAFAQWMDTCNAQAYPLIASANPPAIADLISGLPAMVWPTA